MYAVVFSPGLSGTWLAWFINQHRNFPQFDIQPVHRLDIHTDYALPVANLIYREYNSDIHQDKNNTFKKSTTPGLIQEVKQYTGTQNPDFIKLCVKLFPEHRFNRDEHLIANVLSEFNITHVIYPYVADVNRDMITDRLFALKRMFFPPIGNVEMDDFLNETMMSLLPGQPLADLHKHTNLVTIDIGKFLATDETEYNKILNAIQEPPLDNWKQLVDEMRNNVYCNDLSPLLHEWHRFYRDKFV